VEVRDFVVSSSLRFRFCIDYIYDIFIELIPKLKTTSLNLEFGIINRASDHENGSELL
jgi:hypothetical protein